MASLDFEKEKNIFREHFDLNQALFKRAASLVDRLIASLTSGNSDLEAPHVIHRVKDREECIKKFSRKYQTQLESDKTQYAIADHITDLLGIRVVCYYETDISKVVQIVRDNFEVIEESDKSAELEAQENVFGYKGHHLDIRINGLRADLPEYKEYKTLRFEVQVRSTIQDAWSILDHKIKYKKSIPHSLKRQINALAALFEIADREFTNIKELTKELKQSKSETAGKPSEEPPTPLDVFEFLAVVQPYFVNFQFQGYKADGFVQEINRWKPSFTAANMSSAMQNFEAMVGEYADHLDKKNGAELNPYTRIRHVLYVFDKQAFSLILYDIQRANFDEWLSQRQSERPGT